MSETNLRYIDLTIHQFLNSHVKNSEIMECIQYAMAGGKRVRSLIYLELVGQLLGECDEATRQTINDGFLYIELIHGASLVLDDMPHMDNDQVRRDLPTVHVKFGHAKAQLSAFIMIHLAHSHLADTIAALYKKTGYLDAHQYAELQVFLHSQNADFLGESGLAGGQYLDLFSMGERQLDSYLDMVERKTSRLYELAFVMPYCLVAASDCLSSERYQQYCNLGRLFGLIFQLLDDLVDFQPAIVSTGNNILDYVDKTTASGMIEGYFTQCQELTRNLGVNIDTIWQLLATKFVDFSELQNDLSLTCL